MNENVCCNNIPVRLFRYFHSTLKSLVEQAAFSSEMSCLYTFQVTFRNRFGFERCFVRFSKSYTSTLS